MARSDFRLSYTHTCDVYSFGILLREMQTEKLPFEAELEVDREGVVKEKILDEQLPRRPTIKNQVPIWLKEMMEESREASI
jgi:serine/threonine protein kinase